MTFSFKNSFFFFFCTVNFTVFSAFSAFSEETQPTQSIQPTQEEQSIGQDNFSKTKPSTEQQPVQKIAEEDVLQQPTQEAQLSSEQKLAIEQKPIEQQPSIEQPAEQQQPIQKIAEENVLQQRAQEAQLSPEQKLAIEQKPVEQQPSIEQSAEQQQPLIEQQLAQEKKNKALLLMPPTTLQTEEALFLRKIVDFWEEGEVQIVKTQIQEYIKTYNESPFCQYLYALLGDIFLQEKNYSDAVFSYLQVTDSEMKQKIFFSLLQGYYYLERFQPLEEACLSYLKFHETKDEEFFSANFFLAESYLRRALQEQKADIKAQWTEKAKPVYETLLESSFKLEAMHALADIHCSLKDYASAAAWYLTLSEQNPEQKEECLFQAANLQTYFDPEAALKNFTIVYKIAGTRAADATYNLLVLLFEQKKYQQIIQEYEQLYSLLSAEQKPHVLFLVGQSYFLLENYSKAAEILQQTLSRVQEKSLEMRSIAAVLMNCGEKLGDLDVFSMGFHQFETYFPDDPEMGKSLLKKALLHQKKQQYIETKEILDKVQKKYFTSLEEKELFFFTYAHLQDLKEEYVDSSLRFRQFLKDFPQSSFEEVSYRSLITLSLKILEKAPQEQGYKQALLEDLSLFLEKWASDEEKRDFSFLLAQTQFDLAQYDQAMQNFSEWIEKYPGDQHIAQAHLLCAYCYRQKLDLDKFCAHAQEALKGNLDSKEEADLHLALFNAYIELSEKTPEVLALAEDHLFQAQNLQDVELNNLLWLSDRFFSQIQKFVQENGRDFQTDQIAMLKQKALFLLEKIFEKNLPDKQFNEKSLFLEASLIKLAKLYGMDRQFDKQVVILEDLIEQYHGKKELSWAHHDQALLDLALVREETKEFSKAITALDQIIFSEKPSNFLFMAKLHKAIAELSALDSRDIHLTNPIVMKSLDELKKLKIQKKLENEPVHLEAALYCIDLQILLEKDAVIEKKSRLLNKMKEDFTSNADLQVFDEKEGLIEKKLGLLEKLKEDFSSAEDIPSQDYQRCLKLIPDKAKIYQGYMKWIEAQIALCHYEMKKSSKDSSARQYKEEAKKILFSLIEEKLLTTSYLHKKVRQAISQLEEDKETVLLFEDHPIEV